MPLPALHVLLVEDIELNVVVARSVLEKMGNTVDVAMTGEITLRGEVLPIGGLKEKLLAALRGGIKTVLIPEENVKDLQEIPDNVKSAMEIVPVRWIDKVLEVANAPGEKINAGELAKGIELAAAGTDIDYVGATGVELIGPGEAQGSYRVYEIEDGAALLGAALIQFASGKWPAAPPPGDDSED